MQRKHTALTGVTMLATLGGLVGAVAPAQAASAAVCNGRVVNQTYTGDVVVPQHSSCVLDRVTVNGNVTVQGAGNLLMMASRVNGVVTGEQHSYVNSWNSTATGVSLYGAWGAYLARTTVTDQLRSSLAGYAQPQPVDPGVNPQVFVGDRSTIGRVYTGDSALVIDGATLNDGLYYGGHMGWGGGIDVRNSTISGSFGPGGTDGVTLCGNDIRNDASVAYTSGATVGSVDGRCAGNRFRGDLATSFIPAMSFNRNLVQGRAYEGFSPTSVKLTGTGNRFLGGTGGAFTAFAQQPGNSTQGARTTGLGQGSQVTKQQDRTAIKAALVKRGQEAMAAADRHGRIKLHR